MDFDFGVDFNVNFRWNKCEANWQMGSTVANSKAALLGSFHDQDFLTLKLRIREDFYDPGGTIAIIPPLNTKIPIHLPMFIPSQNSTSRAALHRHCQPGPR